MCKTLSDVPEINEEDETHEHPAAAGEKVGFSRGEATLWTTVCWLSPLGIVILENIQIQDLTPFQKVSFSYPRPEL